MYKELHALGKDYPDPSYAFLYWTLIEAVTDVCLDTISMAGYAKCSRVRYFPRHIKTLTVILTSQIRKQTSN